MFTRVLMCILVCFLIVGGIDRLIGNKIGIGAEFERGFYLMGTTTLSVVGLIVLAPPLASALTAALTPVFDLIGADPAMFPGMFTSTEISLPLALAMTEQEQIAKFSGIIVGSCMGGVISFTIPLACGLIKKEDYRYFSAGTLTGFIFDPLACFIGGLVMGLPAGIVLIQLIPVIVFAVILVLLMLFIPEPVMKAFRYFSKFLMAVVTFGLLCGAVESMTGFVIIPGLNPISDGFRTIGTIALSVASALCFLFVIRKAFKRPLAALAAKIGIDELSIVNIIMSATTIVPGYSTYEKMNGKGKLLFAALTAAATPALGVHLGVTSAMAPEMIFPMLVCRVCGGVFAVISALLFSRRLFRKEELM